MKKPRPSNSRLSALGRWDPRSSSLWFAVSCRQLCSLVLIRAPGFRIDRLVVEWLIHISLEEKGEARFPLYGAAHRYHPRTTSVSCQWINHLALALLRSWRKSAVNLNFFPNCPLPPSLNTNMPRPFTCVPFLHVSVLSLSQLVCSSFFPSYFSTWVLDPSPARCLQDLNPWLMQRKELSRWHGFGTLVFTWLP